MIVLIHTAPEREGGFDCLHDRFLIGHRQRPRVAHADGADRGVRFLAKCVVVASAEEFGLRVHLRMHLESDDCF